MFWMIDINSISDANLLNTVLLIIAEKVFDYTPAPKKRGYTVSSLSVCLTVCPSVLNKTSVAFF